LLPIDLVLIECHWPTASVHWFKIACW